ncbi:MAG: alpha/beta hydrolase [Geminicoccaceae bacterium]
MARLRRQRIGSSPEHLARAALIVVAAFTLSACEFLLYHPSGMERPADGSSVGGYQVRHLDDDPSSQSYVIQNELTGPGRLNLLYLQGNAGSFVNRLCYLDRFTDDGFGVTILSYRGYGGNRGRPREQGLYQDARRALAHLAAKGVSSNEIVLYGESLGTGVAATMALEASEAGNPHAALIMQAPYTSISAVVRFLMPWLPVKPSWLLGEVYDTRAKISRIEMPLLFIHGRDDDLIPAGHSRELFELAAEPKALHVIEGAGHNDLTCVGARRVDHDDVCKSGGPVCPYELARDFLARLNDGATRRYAVAESVGDGRE